ncbi:MAG: hypothetical protein QOI10_865 [Solirubrobacterales bacterium]|nr:hypothetical protein [Solirubrobacterales bacterium]
MAPAGERGQSIVEWIGLVLLVALALSSLGALAGVGLPGAALARAIGGRIVCALSLAGDCELLGPSDLVLAYGGELAGLVAETAPQIRYEPGMRALPVDFRHCREDACAEGRDGIRVARSLTGEPAAVFTHVVDCRAGTETPGADCAGEAAGNRYVQYWLYYPGSATGEGSTILRGAIRELSEDVGHPTYHRDDWESVQFRIHPDGSADVRASAHYGYGPGWEPAGDSSYTVSGGSHAGTVEPAEFDRITTPRRLALIPLEPIADADPDTEFAITPPWYKRVWLEPEYEGTD